MSGFILARLTGSSTHTAGTAAPPAIRRRSAWALIVVASAALATGIWVYTANTRAVQGIVGWELNTAEPFGRPLRPAVRTAVKWDFAFIGGYTIALAIGLFLIQCVARSALARRLAYADPPDRLGHELFERSAAQLREVRGVGVGYEGGRDRFGLRHRLHRVLRGGAARRRSSMAWQCRVRGSCRHDLCHRAE